MVVPVGTIQGCRAGHTYQRIVESLNSPLTLVVFRGPQAQSDLIVVVNFLHQGAGQVAARVAPDGAREAVPANYQLDRMKASSTCTDVGSPGKGTASTQRVRESMKIRSFLFPREVG